jgi:L-ascorbate metabolism protein UlaG (beta-lactamase superfamily)
VKQVVPMHYGTFPALTGTPAELREARRTARRAGLELKPASDG